MAQNDEWWKAGAPVEQAASDDWWKAGTPVDQPKPRTRGLVEALNDNVIEFANAAAGGVSSAANFLSPGNKLSSFIDENIIKSGEQKQSDVVRAEKQRLSEGLQNAGGVADELGAVGSYVVNNPLLAASQAAGSFALPGGVVKGAGGAAKALGAGVKGIEAAGRAGGIAAGAAMAGGDAAGTAYELSKKAGATDEQAMAAGRQASIIPAAVGGLTGAFGAERLLAGGQGFAGNALSRGLKSGLSEAAQEGLEEGVTQYEGQRAAMPYDATIDPSKGVAGAAGMGAIMGFGPGAVLGAVQGGPDAAAGGPDLSQPAPQADQKPVANLGYSPLAGTPIVFPDGSVALNGEQEFAKRFPDVKPSQAMGINPAAGPLSRAAASSVDSAPQPVAPTAPVADAVPLEQRSLDELRQAFRSAQDPAIRKTLAAEIRKRREAMPDPLAQPSLIPETAQVDAAPVAQEVQQPQPVEVPSNAAQKLPESPVAQTPDREKNPASVSGSEPVTQSEQAGGDGINVPSNSGSSVEDQQRIAGSSAQLSEETNARRTPDVLRGTSDTSSGAGTNLPDTGMGDDVAGSARTEGATTPVIPEQGQSGSGEQLSSGADALTRPNGWRSNAIKAGKVAKQLGLDPKDKRLAQIVAEIDAKDGNVQDTPQGTAGEATKAAPVEAREAEGGNAAASAGVPAAPGASDAQADGVKKDVPEVGFGEMAKQEPFVHAGLKIETRRIKVGDGAQVRWVVQSPENSEREDRGERQIGGDRIVDSREQAIKTAEQEAKRYADEKAYKAEIDSREKADREIAEAKKEANRKKSLPERRADAVLDKPTSLPPSFGLGLGSKREAMQKAVEQGRAIREISVRDTAAKKRDEDAVNRVRVAGYILGASNENIPVVKAGLEAQARLKENKYEKPEYRVHSGSSTSDSYREISKTEYDYAQKLIAENQPAADGVSAQPQSAAPKEDAAKDAGDDAFMGAKVKDERDLIVTHNLTEDNLLYADSLGGIPAPSIGITKMDTPFGGFGDITLIAPSEMVNPENGTPVFDRDAWTSRFPTMNFKKVKAKVADAFYERMKPAKELGNDGDSFMSMLWEEMRNASVQRPDKITSLFMRYNAPKMLYARDVLGKSIKAPMRDVQLSSPAASDKQLQAYWKKNGARLVELDRELSGFDFSNTPEYKAFMGEIEGAVRRYAESVGQPDRADSYVSMFLPDGQLGPGSFNRIVKDFENAGKKEVDGIKLSEALRKVVPEDDAAYQRWVKSLVEPLFETPTITVRGREVEPTLENIVDAMTIGVTQGAEKSMTFSAGKTAAMLGKRYKSMAEIKADRARVVSQEQEGEAKKATEAILDQYRTKVAGYFTQKDWRGNIDTWAALDSSMEALAKAGKAGGSNADIRQALVRSGFKSVDQETVDLAKQAIDALRNAATDYFEAKPQRALKLNEFRGAVVPKGISQEAKDALTKNGIEVVEYSKKVDGARDAAIKKLAKKLDKERKDIAFFNGKQRANATPVDRAVMDMAGEGREANDILRFIAGASKSPFRRQLADLLVKTGANPSVSLGGDMGGGQGFKFLAKYSRKNHEVTLSEAASDRAEQILLHETVHSATLMALDRGGQYADQMKRLAAQVYKVASPEMRKQYGLTLKKGTSEVNVGEFVAEAFTNPEFQKHLKGIPVLGRSAWQRFVAMVRRIIGMDVGAQNALEQALELGAKVMRENVALRKAQSFRAEDGPAFAGVDQTETEAFKKWFGDSKVVDANGKPLVVYHGTVGDVTSFDPDRAGQEKYSDWGKGIYFTPSASTADYYRGEAAKRIDTESDRLWELLQAEEKKTTWKNGAPTYTEEHGRLLEEWRKARATAENRAGSVMPVYLSLQNPLIQGYSRMPDPDLANRAKAKGHDGIIVLNGAGGIDEIVAFRPEQIKSATGNRGTFDPDDADISHFGIADAAEQIKAFDVKTAPKNTWAHYRGMALQALGRRQITELYAEELPQLETYNDLVQKMDAEKNDSGAEADRVAQDWGSLKEGMDRKLADLMHDATLAKMDPDKDMPAGYSKKEYDALKARFDALSPEAKAVYRKARDMYVDHYKAVQQSIKERIERSDMSEGQKRKLMADLDSRLFKELQGVYFPLARFGQYVIVVKNANGEVVNVTRAETVKEAETVRKELQKAFPAHMGNTVGKVLKQAEFNAGRDAVGKGFMADLMGALDEKGVDDELRDTVAQLYLSSLPDLSWAKHGIHRKGTPGFSQDARRAFAQNMFHGARYLAKLRHADQLQDLLIEMQDHVKAYEGVEEYDSIQAQQVVDEMVKRHEWLMNPKSSPVSTALTSFGFLFHMGLSPASAMVNLTQTALVAYPQMGAKWGFAKAGAALTKASQEVVKAKNDLSTVLKGDELDAFNQAVKDGTIDVTMAHDLAGIAQGEDQGVMWKVRPVMRWASFMFHHAEKFNRQATFIAAYRLAKEQNPNATQRQLYEQAKQATYDGHFDYSASNRARIMQGNWQRVIFLFKQYSQAMVYTLARNAYQSVKALDPKERTQARKTLAGILAAHAAAAGVLGLPLVGPLLTVASWIGGDDDEPWDAEVAMQNAMAEMLGPKASEVIARGFSRLTPFDLSGRVALNKLILPDVQEGLEGKEWAESAMAAALGPVAGIGVNVARGAQKITEGDYLRGLEDMMPTALRGPLKAMRYASEGAVDKTGVVITDEVSAAGVLGQASGFSPSQVRRDTERRGAIYAYDRALLERRSVLMRMFAEARMNGDEETVQEVQKDIQRFNEKNPTRRITPMNLAQSIRNRRKRVQEAEQGVYLPSKRRDALDAVTF
jgi:hypothetical protein